MIERLQITEPEFTDYIYGRMILENPGSPDNLLMLVEVFRGDRKDEVSREIVSKYGTSLSALTGREIKFPNVETFASDISQKLQDFSNMDVDGKSAETQRVEALLRKVNSY
jgi:hypothetical protein